MDYQTFKEIIESGIALRYTGKHHPVGGPGSKVFPSLYAEKRYAFETRLIEGEKVTCVIMDTVASQANRMEASIESVRNELVHGLPGVSVSFPPEDPDLQHIGTITDLVAPHRIADAIFRDSTYQKQRFPDSDLGQILRTASVCNATGMFGLSPVSLVFGFWDSTSRIKGRNYRFERTISSEIIGVDAVPGIDTRSRIDPLSLTSMPVYYSSDDTCGWSPEQLDAAGKKREVIGKLTKILHSNVCPHVVDSNGGVTLAHALHTILLSLPALRRLQFPDTQGTITRERNNAAHTTLAAIALVGATRLLEGALELRSRTILEPEQTDTWEVVRAHRTYETATITPTDAIDLLDHATDAALEQGLPWHEKPFELQPSTGLVEAIRRTVRAGSSLISEESE